jgi:hypothetical protein
MTAEQENYIRTNFKWPYSWEVIVKYFLVMCICTVSLFAFKGYEDNPNNDSNLIVFLLGFCLSAFALIRVRSERRFRSLKLNSGITTNEVKQKLESFGWVNLYTGKDKLEFRDKGSLFSAGVTVTIILVRETELLINSRPFGKHPFTLNRDIVIYNRIRLLFRNVYND